jgi:hypothetical protein
MLVKCHYIVTSGVGYLRALINSDERCRNESCTQARRVFTPNSFHGKERLTT